MEKSSALPVLGQRDRPWEASLEVHIVPRDDVFYKRGRALAESVYRQVWGTDALVDGNHYGAIVTWGDIAIGNVNIQTRRSDRELLKSEQLYGCCHWSPEVGECPARIAEISGLAIGTDVPMALRRPAMMMLILGLQMLSRSFGIRHYVTIQRPSLIRMLTRSLRLPFQRNDRIVRPVGETPRDRYWQDGQMPRLYYLDLASPQAVDVCTSFFCYLSTAGWHTAFYPRVGSTDEGFSAFRRAWHPGTNTAVVSA